MPVQKRSAQKSYRGGTRKALGSANKASSKLSTIAGRGVSSKTTSSPRSRVGLKKDVTPSRMTGSRKVGAGKSIASTVQKGMRKLRSGLSR